MLAHAFCSLGEESFDQVFNGAIRTTVWPPRPGRHTNVIGVFDRPAPFAINMTTVPERCFLLLGSRGTAPGSSRTSVNFGRLDVFNPEGVMTLAFKAVGLWPAFARQVTAAQPPSDQFLFTLLNEQFAAPSAAPTLVTVLEDGSYNVDTAYLQGLDLTVRTVRATSAGESARDLNDMLIAHQNTRVDGSFLRIRTAAGTPCRYVATGNSGVQNVVVEIDLTRQRLVSYLDGAVQCTLDTVSCLDKAGATTPGPCVCGSAPCLPAVSTEASAIVGVPIPRCMKYASTGLVTLFGPRECPCKGLNTFQFMGPSLALDDIMIFSRSAADKVAALQNYSIADRAAAAVPSVSLVPTCTLRDGPLDDQHCRLTPASPTDLVPLSSLASVSIAGQSEVLVEEATVSSVAANKSLQISQSYDDRGCVRLSVTNGSSLSSAMISSELDGLTTVRISARAPDTGGPRHVASASFNVITSPAGAIISNISQDPPGDDLFVGEAVVISAVVSGVPLPDVVLMDETGAIVSICNAKPLCEFTIPSVGYADGGLPYELFAQSRNSVLREQFSLVSINGTRTIDLDASSDDAEQLSSGGIAGIVVGSFFVLAASTVGVICCLICLCCVVLILVVVAAVIIVVVAVAVVAVLVAAVGVTGASGGGVLVATKMIVKRIKDRRIKLPNPDFQALAFGSYMNPMFQITARDLGRYEPLREIVVNSDYRVAQALAKAAGSTELEGVTKALVYLFHMEGIALGLQLKFISAEVSASTSEGTLFRQDSASSKMFNSYARIVGLRYCFSIFALPVNKLQIAARKVDGAADEGEEMDTLTGSLTGASTMEVDPKKLQDASDASVNTLELWILAEQMLQNLMRSIDNFPPEFSELLAHVRDLVLEKYTQVEATRAMGGFLFLRFLCPSLMAPHYYGLLSDPPSPTAQRQLILLGKVLQNLANNTLPGVKEEFMRRLNDFITDNIDRLNDFYARATAARNQSRDAVDVPNIVAANALADLHYFLNNKRKAALKVLAEDVDAQTAEEVGKILDALGEPSPKAKK